MCLWVINGVADRSGAEILLMSYKIPDFFCRDAKIQFCVLNISYFLKNPCK
jgi:hypothetical protein